MLAGDPHSQLTSASLLERLELECWEVPNRLMKNRKRRAELGQFMTPANVAAFLASMLEIYPPPKNCECLMPAAGLAY